MSQLLVQNSTTELVVVLATTGGAPATGLTTADIDVEYRKEEEPGFTVKDLTDTPASVASAFIQPFSLSANQTLQISVDGGATQTVTLSSGDFGAIGSATAAELVTVINADTTGLTASISSGSVVLTSDTDGEASTIQVLGGTANTYLGFPTTEETGQTFFEEIGDGVYVIEFTEDELDTLGSFTVKITGGTIAQFVTIASIIEGTVEDEETTISVCEIVGNVRDVGGNPVANATVAARILGFPTILSNAVVLTDDVISAVTNSNGDFSLELAVGAMVDITIPRTNYRRQLVVPNQESINLFTIS